MFTVGEFSTLAQVSKRLLRYYDEIGLLRPAHTDPITGYRFYKAEQMAHLNRILVLKELGLSLDQIKRLLINAITTEEMQGMLLLKKAEVEQKLRAELQRIRKIEARLQSICSAENETPPDVVIKFVPVQPVLSVRGVFESFESALAVHRMVQRALPARSERGVSFTICYDEFVVERDMRLEIGRLIEADSHAPVPLEGDLTLQYALLPEVECMATAVVTGPLEMLHTGYGRIGLWTEANGYRVAGIHREIILHAGEAVDGYDLVTEIQIPVEPRTETGGAR